MSTQPRSWILSASFVLSTACSGADGLEAQQADTDAIAAGGSADTLQHAVPNTQASTIDDSELATVKLAATSGLCDWNCGKCCKTVWGVRICEPTCKSLCEAHNATCHSVSICSAIRVADPNFDTLKDVWQKARNVGVFGDQNTCNQIADGGPAVVGALICASGNVLCSLLTATAAAENKCFCSQITY